MSDVDQFRAFVEQLPDGAVRVVVEHLVRGLVMGVAEEIAEHAVAAILKQLDPDGGQDELSPYEAGYQAGAANELSGAHPDPVPTLAVVETPAAPQAVTEIDSGEHVCDVCGRIGTQRFKRTGANWRCAQTVACVKRRDARSKPAAPPRSDHAEHTCEVCGRVGSRRFTETATGWRCSPTATACPGHTQSTPEPAAAAEIDTADVEYIASAVTPTPASPPPPMRVTVPAHVPTPRPTTKPKPAPPDRSASDVTAHCQDCTRTWRQTGRELTNLVEAHELAHSHVVAVKEGATP